MAPPSRRRSQQAARERAAARQAAAARRRRVIAAVVALLVVLSVVGAYLGSTRSASTSRPATTTTSLPTSTTRAALPPTGVTPPPVPVGQALTGPTPCPAEDGSSPRVTSFAEAPPTCIDTGFFYTATIATSKGDLTLQLNPSRAPETVNDFVVLARYHYYDGQPVTAVQRRASFTIGVALSGDGSDKAPGFALPDEAPGQGQVLTPGTISMTGSTAGANRGQLLVATYEDAAGIDPGVTPFGIMLSGDDTLAAIDRLASQAGEPTEVVTVEGVTVTRGSAVPS